MSSSCRACGEPEEDVLEVGCFGGGLEDGDSVLGGENADLLAGGAGNLHSIGGGDGGNSTLDSQDLGQVAGPWRANAHDAGTCEGEIGEAGLGDEPAMVQDHHAVGSLSDLGEDVAGDKHGAPFPG